MTYLWLFLLGAVGLTFGLVNKLPESWYEGQSRMARRLRCAYCAGVYVGLWVYPAWAIVDAAVGDETPWVLLLLWAPFAGATGLFSQVVQSIGRIAASLEDP